MPEMRYYEVEQTRVVKVRARNPHEAGAIASEFLDHGETATLAAMQATLQGNVLTPIVVTDLNISREQ